MLGICDDNTGTTVCTDRWMIGIKNSAIIAVFATFFASVLGTLAALGLSNKHMPFNRLIMALMISPMIVCLVVQIPTPAILILMQMKMMGVVSQGQICAVHVTMIPPITVERIV